jgi:hypothetical protein
MAKRIARAIFGAPFELFEMALIKRLQFHALLPISQIHPNDRFGRRAVSQLLFCATAPLSYLPEHHQGGE